MLTRLSRAWRGLAPDGRMAAGAALLLFLTMFLPWYQLNAVVNDRTGGKLVGDNMNAFGVFSFVEAAVLLVAIAVLFLLFARAEGRSFHLPGGDGTIVMIAGGWTALLLIWRLFDKPDVDGSGVGNVGIQWGIFFALGAAGLLTYAGARMRAAHRPEPEGPAAETSPEERAARRRRPRPAPGTEPTRPLASERAVWEDAPADPPPGPPRERMPERAREPDDAPEKRAIWDDAPSDPPPDWEEAPTKRVPSSDAPTKRIPSPPPPPPVVRRRARPPLDVDEEPPTQRLPQPERLWDDNS
ncbi:hypothetical protein [Conexibacter sp. CPCC 206217]|uniref:hypothetical protein n=1 Tax=Conexibacter sp. CPCC 206217 TaxID=3064574 RepID=UPI00271A5787|nr:hypothetical protein [Conexibacter sp. CPCC 206217]MDO8209380.1 hypothetical protein [Conexibacter sp. CPCC 206217]